MRGGRVLPQDPGTMVIVRDGQLYCVYYGPSSRRGSGAPRRPSCSVFSRKYLSAIV